MRLALVILLCACSDNQPASGTCAPGEVSVGGECRQVCRNDLDCGPGAACVEDTCGPCNGCRAIPQVTRIDGTGTADGAAHHLDGSVVLEGSNLAGVRV